MDLVTGIQRKSLAPMITQYEDRTQRRGELVLLVDNDARRGERQRRRRGVSIGIGVPDGPPVDGSSVLLFPGRGTSIARDGRLSVHHVVRTVGVPVAERMAEFVSREA
jgi:hypothetical protein